MSAWPKAVVFDLDGTLVDTAPDIMLALNQVLAERALPPYDVAMVRTLIGGGVPKLLERALRPHARTIEQEGGNALLKRFMELYVPRSTDETQVYEGVEAELERLHGSGVRCGVCTNKPGAVSRRILEAFGLERYMLSVVGGDTGLPKKPDSAPMLRVLRELNVRPADAVSIGDSGIDVALARAVGMPVIVVSYGYSKAPPSQLGGDLIIDRFEQLQAAFVRLGDKVGLWA